MGGSSKAQTIGYKYYLGMHLALCHGPVDKVIRIKVDDKEAWLGENAGGQITLDAEDLFGGEKREGGVSGKVDIEMGAPDQGQNSYLVSKLGALVPGFRGVCAAVLRQVYVGMNPYLKPWAFRVQRVHTRNGGETQWYDAKSAIEAEEGEAELVWPDEVGSLGDYTLETGYADAFGVTIGGHMLTQASAEDGHSTLTKSIALDFAPTVVEFKVKLNSLPNLADDCGEIALYNDDDVRLFGFGAARESSIDSLNRPVICGRYTCADIDSVVGTEHLVLGRTYQFHGEVSGISMVCTLTDTATGEIFASATVDGAALDGPSDGHHLAALRYSVDHVPSTSTNTGGAGSSEFWDLRLSAPLTATRADMNPAHIIRECLTDLDWGMGYQDADIDDDAFMAAADTLYEEAMGISLLWDRQIPLEDFIKEILRHIDATLYVDRTTGQFTLKLIRADYDPNALLILDPSNVEHVENFKAPALGELVNEVTVRYWDAGTGEDASLSVQDIAMVQVQGTTISATSEYPGFTNGSLASRVAARDLRALSTPLVSCTLYVNRAAAGLNVGDVFRLDWPDYGAANLIMRVTQIALGDGRSNVVRVTCVQDVFGLPLAIHAPPSASEWEAPDLVPSPSLHSLAIEAPYYELVQRLGQSTVDSNLAERPDLGYLLVAGDRQGADLNARIMVDAGAGFVDGGAMDFAPYAALAADVSHIAEAWVISGGIDLDLVVDGTHAQIDDEIVEVVTVGETSLAVKRGVLDTIPATHAAGAMILFWDEFAATDEIEYVSGETVDAKILPSTGAQSLGLASVEADSCTFAQRAWRPYPPGQFKINAEYWPETIGGAEELALTWAHRDRSQQTDGTLTDYSAASIGPETGTAYTVRVYGEADALVHTETALTGTDWTYAAATEAAESNLSGGGSPIPGVVLCLNMNGTDGSTTFIDDTGKTVTATGDVEIDTEQSKFGGASGRFNGGYLTVPDSADWNFASGDFTIELWARWPSNGPAIFACQDVDANNIWLFKYFSSVPRLEVAIKNAGSWVLDQHDAAWTPTDGTWHHLALTRSGNTIRIFADGVLKGSAGTYAGAFPDYSVPLKIGQTSNWSSYTTTAHFDGLRIIKGTALYTANFTPPSAPPATSNPGTNRINGRLRIELESVRYAEPIVDVPAYQISTPINLSQAVASGAVIIAPDYYQAGDPNYGQYFYRSGDGGISYTRAEIIPSAFVTRAMAMGVDTLIGVYGEWVAYLDDPATNDDAVDVSVGEPYRSTGVFNGSTAVIHAGSDIFWYLGKGYTAIFDASGHDITVSPNNLPTDWTAKLIVEFDGDIYALLYQTQAVSISWMYSVRLYKSTDGLDWAMVYEALPDPVTHYSTMYYSMRVCGSILVLVGRRIVAYGDTVPAILSTPDGTVYASTIYSQGRELTQLGEVDGKYIAVGYGTSAISDDGANWTVTDNSIFKNGGLFSDGTVALYSQQAWTQDGPGITWQYLKSTDGETWTDFTSSLEIDGATPENEAVPPIGGIASWQHHDHTVYRAGYGFNYGMFYGGV